MNRAGSPLGLLAAVLIATALPAVSNADDNAPSARPTFYADVLPILQNNCQDCHRPAGLNLGGMIAPMSLMDYSEVRPWAKSIASAVESRQMPPWHAAENFHGTFANERTLSDAQIDTLVRWASTGAAQGDPAQAPDPKVWTSGEWAIGEPDLILTLDEPFFVEDDVEDLNIDLTTQITAEQLPEDKFITAIEFKPGSDVVHHIIGMTIPPKTGDAQGIQMIGGIAPGTAPTQYPDGYGVKLHAGSTFIFQMHYHKEPGPGTGKHDRSSIAFKFADKPVQRLYIEAIGDTRRLYVPAGDPAYRITSERKFGRDVKVLAMLPHMHLRGDYSKYHLVMPDGKAEDLLEVPKYDFNWQTSYQLKEPKIIPAGSVVQVTMGYDNSANNPANPDPTVDVAWGSPTTDEMNLGWMTWAYVEPTANDPVPRAIGGGNDGL